MGLASEMKNLSEEILSSFKQRIKENAELVMEVQKTLDGFHNDHQEMAAALNANAASLRKGLARGEKDRLNTYKDLMAGIHKTIGSIQKEVAAIQTSTFNMIADFNTDRAKMAEGLNKFFAHGRSDRMKNEKIRMKEFDSLMKDINDDIKSINEEVSSIFKDTNDMLAMFEKEHTEMSAELRNDLSLNLAERVEYTRSLLQGFQKRLSEISKENQKMAQNLRKDLDDGETNRLNEYKEIMNGIHTAIKGIRKEVKDIQKASSGMVGGYAKERVQGSAEWSKMQDAVAQLRKKGFVAPPKETAKKVEKKEVKMEVPVEAVKETPVKKEPISTIVPATQKTLKEKVLAYVNKHPNGVKISEMEVPLGETRMKLGFTAKALLDEAEVLKVENMYYPKPKS